MVKWRRAMALCVRLFALFTVLAVACGGRQAHDRAAGKVFDPNAVRYRLRLRDNPVDAGEAFRCYGGCQVLESPKDYVQCLSKCPGFEQTAGARCDATEIPPAAACVTVRRLPADAPIPRGMIVIAVVADVALVVALTSLCASSPTACGYYYPAPH